MLGTASDPFHPPETLTSILSAAENSNKPKPEHNRVKKGRMHSKEKGTEKVRGRRDAENKVLISEALLSVRNQLVS